MDGNKSRIHHNWKFGEEGEEYALIQALPGEHIHPWNQNCIKSSNYIKKPKLHLLQYLRLVSVTFAPAAVMDFAFLTHKFWCLFRNSLNQVTPGLSTQLSGSRNVCKILCACLQTCEGLQLIIKLLNYTSQFYIEALSDLVVWLPNFNVIKIHKNKSIFTVGNIPTCWL